VNDPAKVQIIIPVHNRREITNRCLDHLTALGVNTWAGVIIVNDGSKDGTLEMIMAHHPWVQVIQGDGSLWWTGAIAAGMRTASRAGADCIVWLNDDTLPDPGSLERLVEEAQSDQAICGAVCRGDDKQTVTYGGGTFRKGWPSPIRKIGEQEGIQVEWLHGNLVAIPRLVWQRCGLPDAKHLPHNLADISYTYGAHRAGIRVKLLPSASASASANDSASYWSWLDPRLGAVTLLTGLWNKKMWWYAPGVVHFQWHHFSWQGVRILVPLTLKLLVLLPIKVLLPGRSLTWLTHGKGLR